MLKNIIFERNQLTVEKETFQKWFRFSKKEKNGLLIFLFIVISFFTIPHFFPHKTSISEIEKQNIVNQPISKGTKASLFTFDPNTLDKIGWLKLGLKEKTANTILHYCQKGGRFRTAEDIRKIYGLKSADADRLIPYIKIPQTSNTTNTIITAKHYINPALHFPIEINHAGWQHFAKLPGVNEKLAQRIVHYRDAIHGFRSIDDIGKTYGLSPLLFEKIKPLLRYTAFQDDVTIDKIPPISQIQTTQAQKTIATKININSAILSEFMQTRKIPKGVAEAIIVYREQHGNYNSVADIKNIAFINNDLFDRISPYLKTEED